MRHLRIHTGHVRAVAYSSDGEWLFSAGNDRTVRRIEVAAGKVRRKWGPFGNIMSNVVVSPSGSVVVAAGAHSGIQVMAVEGEYTRTYLFREPLGLSYPVYVNISAIGFDPRGTRFFAGTGDRSLARQSGEVCLWECSTERRWDEGRREAAPVLGSVWSGAFSPDGTTLALGTGRGWRFCTLSPWSIGELHTRGPGTKSLAWSPDGRTLAVASGHSILLVHVETNAVRATLTGHEAPILALAFTPDGQRLLSGGWDQNVRVWDPVAASPVAAYDWERGKVHTIAVAPDGMTAAAACDKGIVLWDLDD